MPVYQSFGITIFIKQRSTVSGGSNTFSVIHIQFIIMFMFCFCHINHCIIHHITHHLSIIFIVFYYLCASTSLRLTYLTIFCQLQILKTIHSKNNVNDIHYKVNSAFSSIPKTMFRFPFRQRMESINCFSSTSFFITTL